MRPILGALAGCAAGALPALQCVQGALIQYEVGGCARTGRLPDVSRGRTMLWSPICHCHFFDPPRVLHLCMQ